MLPHRLGFILVPSAPLCGHFKIVFSRSRRQEACPDIPRSSRREPAPILISKAISPDGTGISTEGNKGNKAEKPLCFLRYLLFKTCRPRRLGLAHLCLNMLFSAILCDVPVTADACIHSTENVPKKDVCVKC